MRWRFLLSAVVFFGLFFGPFVFGNPFLHTRFPWMSAGMIFCLLAALSSALFWFVAPAFAWMLARSDAPKIDEVPVPAHVDWLAAGRGSLRCVRRLHCLLVCHGIYRDQCALAAGPCDRDLYCPGKPQRRRPLPNSGTGVAGPDGFLDIYFRARCDRHSCSRGEANPALPRRRRRTQTERSLRSPRPLTKQ